MRIARLFYQRDLYRQPRAAVQQAATNTTGAVLPPHRPKKQAEESGQIAHLSQTQRATSNGVSHRTQRKLDRLAARGEF
jgi:hypothetical protein